MTQVIFRLGANVSKTRLAYRIKQEIWANARETRESL